MRGRAALQVNVMQQQYNDLPAQGHQMTSKIAYMCGYVRLVFIHCAQAKGSNGLTVTPQTSMVCPNNQYVSTQRTCEDFGNTLALSANGKLLLTSGGFPGPAEQLGTYVYQTQNCISTSSSSTPSV